MKQVTLITLLIIVLLFHIADAQVNNSLPLEQRAKDVMRLFQSAPNNYEQYFSSSFLSQVPAARLTSIFTYFFSNLGKCIKVERTSLDNQYSGKFNFIFEKNMSAPVTLTVDAAEPHLITGLLIGNPVSIAGSFADIIKELKNLPGESSMLVIKISGNKIDTLASYNAERELAIGSAFKLYILSELLRTINNGTIKWAEVVNLQQKAVSLPSGFLQKWPAGSPLTIHSLAALMISQSDNTAADQMLNYLGREKVEKMLSVTGHSKPELNMPFLSTSEMFKLKGESSLQSAHEYLSKSEGGRRAFLKNVVSKISLDSLTLSPKPAFIDSIEWFASAADLCNVMKWIILNSGKEPGAEARKILAINPGLSFSKDQWKYVGFKGGSEAGVMNMTYLLQSVNGNWYAFSAGWNNTNAPVDESKFIGLAGGAIKLIK